MSRTKRKAYTKSKRFDSSCRNHGGCGYCQANRTWFDKKHRPTKKTLQEYKDE